MKKGEWFMFGFAALVAVAALGKGYKHMSSVDPRNPRDYYEWTALGLEGHLVYRELGCNSCHRVLGVGEMGVAPVLDGEGTRRSEQWLSAYVRDPGSLVPGTAHDGSLGPDLRELDGGQQRRLVAFLFGLKSNPGSPNHPQPPAEAVVRVEQPRLGE